MFIMTELFKQFEFTSEDLRLLLRSNDTHTAVFCKNEREYKKKNYMKCCEKMISINSRL